MKAAKWSYAIVVALLSAIIIDIFVTWGISTGIRLTLQHFILLFFVTMIFVYFRVWYKCLEAENGSIDERLSNLENGLSLVEIQTGKLKSDMDVVQGEISQSNAEIYTGSQQLSEVLNEKEHLN